MSRSRMAATLLAASSIGLASCGGGGAPTSTSTATSTSTSSAGAHPRARRHAVSRPPPPAYPHVLANALGSSPTPFIPAVEVNGRPAAWIARSASGVALLSFDQRLLGLKLHSGTIDAGTSGWRWGPAVGGAERRRLVAAFNGAFKLSTGSGGFMSYGRTASPLRPGLASIVTYADGSTDIGSWRQELPVPGRAVVSVRQNLTLLIDHGASASTAGCDSCWGAALGGVSDPARSGLGVTADGRLVWGGGEHLTVSQLADAMLGARVVRAVELDINPEWVAGYLYEHHGPAAAPAPVPVVPGQPGVSGQFLVPYSRDFFTVTNR